MRYILLLVGVFSSFFSTAQDLTGTWEGELVYDGYGQFVPKKSKIVWELVQVEKEVYGIVYFYPEDTRPNDQPNCWYSFSGKMGKKSDFPFQFIQSRFIDGLGTTRTYLFHVKHGSDKNAELLAGKWYAQLESLNTTEQPAGNFSIHKVSGMVSDQLWLKRKEKEIIDKLNSKELIDTLHKRG